MNKRPIYSTLMATALALMAGPALAADSKAAPAKQVASQAAATKVKLIDINSADAKTLMTLPDISATDAEKIIAGRPYGSKAWLVTKNIVPAEKYPALKDLVVAKQQFTDSVKNGAALKKAQKPASK